MRYARILAILSILSLVVWTAYSDDVAELRHGGQAAVDELHAQVMKAPPADRAALETRLDRVCGQKDCAASRLFWFTDIEEAKAAAQRLHRPILALHLLGRLDEELSCANSRFFRTLLYSDDSISGVLRDQYVFVLALRAPRAARDDRDGRRPRDPPDDHRQQRALPARRERRRARRAAGTLLARGLPHAVAALGRALSIAANANAASRREIVKRYHASFVPAAQLVDRGRNRCFEEHETDGHRCVEAGDDEVRDRSADARAVQKPTAVPVVDLQPLSEWIAIGEARKAKCNSAPRRSS